MASVNELHSKKGFDDEVKGDTKAERQRCREIENGEPASLDTVTTNEDETLEENPPKRLKRTEEIMGVLVEVSGKKTFLSREEMKYVTKYLNCENFLVIHLDNCDHSNLMAYINEECVDPLNRHASGFACVGECIYVFHGSVIFAHSQVDDEKMELPLTPEQILALTELKSFRFPPILFSDEDNNTHI